MTETLPAVTVVMPNHNKGRFIESAIRSVLFQTLNNFELIVVDDHSTDDSNSVVEAIAARDQRVRLLKHSTRKGPGAARNTGIRNAQGKVVALLDSDDVFAPTWLEHGLDEQKKSSAPSVVYPNWWVMGPSGDRTGGSRGHEPLSGMVFPDFLRRSLEINAALLAPRECFMAAGLYDESIAWGEDYDMVLRLAKRYPFVYLDEEAYGYRLYWGNSWKSFPREQMYRHKTTVLERNYATGKDLLTQPVRALVERRIATYRSLSGDDWKPLITAFIDNLGLPRGIAARLTALA